MIAISLRVLKILTNAWSTAAAAVQTASVRTHTAATRVPVIPDITEMDLPAKVKTKL